MSIRIACVPVLDDNYVWLVHEPRSGDTVAVDPSVAMPVLKEADRRGWRISQIWNTHWHGDHVGGNEEIKRATGCVVSGPAAEADRIPEIDVRLGEGERVFVGDVEGQVLSMPGHTLGHIAIHLAQPRAVFTGDTLFAMGCGRLFEGTAGQMYANMRRLAALPRDTQVYCAHEYTEANGAFAMVAEPENKAIAARMIEVAGLRANGIPTVPSSIALELATNPFMRASSAWELKRRRAAKDVFKG